MTISKFIETFLRLARSIWSKQMYRALALYCRGNVLDVGGRDFIVTALQMNLSFDHWTTLDISADQKPLVNDPRVCFVTGDGCRTTFASESFDTVVNIQVLEHVFDPLQMVQEISRVMKPSGHGIFLIPQTSTLHMAPHHYYNFTRYWILEAMKRSGLEIVELNALGGRWSSTASHLVYFFLQSTRFTGMSYGECRRSALYWLLLPLMVVYALLSIPVCLLLSLGDLNEEPNNHLVVVRKPDVVQPD